MRVKTIVSLLLCIMITILGGCTLVDVNEEHVTEQEKEQPIIEYNGIVVDKHDIEKKMNYYLTQQNMTIKDLSEGTDVDIWERFKHDIVFELSIFQIALAQAADLGLNKLTPVEQKKIDKAYDIGMHTAENYVSKTVEAILQKDKNLDYDIEYNRLLHEYFFLRGYDLETYKKSLKEELIVEKVKMYYTDDITVTNEEVKEKYNYDLQIQQRNMQQQPLSIEQQLLFGTDILYYPEGYMYVKHILVSFDSTDRGTAAIAYVNGNIGEYNKVIADAMPSIQPKIDEILGKLEAGEDFTNIMKQHSDDESLNVEPYVTNGFLIGPYTSYDLTEYLDAIKTLTTEGEYTEPIMTYMGAYIIQCVKLMGGSVPYDDVKNNLKQTMIKQRKAYKWSTLGQNWIDNAINNKSLKTYEERL